MISHNNVRIGGFAAVLGGLILLAACSQEVAQGAPARQGSSTTGEAAGAGDNGACSTAASAIDREGACRLAPATTANFCAEAGLAEGEYVLCAVSPQGNMFVFAAQSDDTFSGTNGWTFGPTSWVPSIFTSLSPLSAADESLCATLAFTTSPSQVPACEAYDGG